MSPLEVFNTFSDILTLRVLALYSQGKCILVSLSVLRTYHFQKIGYL